MKLVKVAAGVLNQTPLDWNGNKSNILSALNEAKRLEASILVLPELCITGYGCDDAFLSNNVQEMALSVLEEILPATKGIILSVGLPLLFQHRLFDSACLIADGEILGFVCKRFLAGDGIHYEPRWFKQWPQGQTAEYELKGINYPIGDLYFDCGGVRFGFEICEDAWAAARPGGRLAMYGVDFILNPSASHFAFSKFEVRKRFVLEGSRAFGVTYVYSPLVGNESGRAIYDGGALIASAGQLIASGERFSYKDVSVTTAVVDLDITRLDRARLTSFDMPESSRESRCINCEFTYPVVKPQPSGVVNVSWEAGQAVKEEEFARAVALGLFDYMRKSFSRGFVVSLSGGADSSAVACLVALMVELVVKDIGIDGFKEKVKYWSELNQAITIQGLVHQVLTCVYQRTRNSSQTTREAARTVANGVGAHFIDIDVDPIVSNYTKLIETTIGRELTWERDDLTLQNIQARVRSPGIWMIANLKSALLLATSNRSEAAVGYTTMDGDTSGGLSPIGGIDKNFLRSWLVWLQTTGPSGIKPFPFLRAVTDQQPTAELRPLEKHQTDEADLMPYEILDIIERYAIRDKKSPLEVFDLLSAHIPDQPRTQMLWWIERFFRLWSRNQWKRERYAPSFHLDDENLDPKTWCRFPILSGGFERELEELRQHVKTHGR